MTLGFAKIVVNIAYDLLEKKIHICEFKMYQCIFCSPTQQYIEYNSQCRFYCIEVSSFVAVFFVDSIDTFV